MIFVSVIDQDVLGEWVMSVVLLRMVPGFKSKYVPVLVPEFTCLLASVQNHEVFVVSVKHLRVSEVLGVKQIWVKLMVELRINILVTQNIEMVVF